ncbi:polyprenyl synthetase family protein [Faecalicatena sp. AGMB00832]|uniref:Polyprenyl synthetase family protein n=1 Tax=Faecalicatena faecalis TaxID=2726362 RepID=A0ABS6D360_9FIRM|nr:farnesyl diphosphate synthase [Faecalicatena faecalis]MBU3875755.1 polyprenyl synthetase family protein [Faecalicatena faecalis]
MNFKETYQRKVEEIEQILRAYLPEQEGYQKVIMEAMEYSLMAGGKRLRPMLMKESYRLFGGESALIEPFMAAIEMIHTYSLVHDDLPAMDNDDYRRGRKTTHVVYGEDMGILAGDALLNYAFETAAKAFDMAPQASLEIGKAMQILAKKAGIYGMIGGQVVDVKSTKTTVSGEVLDFIYKLKTGALIESSMMIGAVLAGADEAQVKTIEEIAGMVGLAFQIQDDILDVISTAEVLGKPIHSDEKNEKTTYVTWKGLDEAKALVEQISMEAIQKLESLNPPDMYLAELLESLIHRDK